MSFQTVKVLRKVKRLGKENMRKKEIIPKPSTINIHQNGLLVSTVKEHINNLP